MTAILPPRPYRIALTGGSGSGKGFVSSLLRKRGIPCLDTDALVHRLYEIENGELPAAIAAAFGSGVLRNGKVYRPALREIVFGHQESLTHLNRIVHAVVREECEKWFAALNEQGETVAVVDAPQLFETGMEKNFHTVIAVSAPAELRIARIMQRDAISQEDAEKRLRNQLSAEEYRQHADFLLENASDGAETERALDAILRELMKNVPETT